MKTNARLPLVNKLENMDCVELDDLSKYGEILLTKYTTGGEMAFLLGFNYANWKKLAIQSRLLGDMVRALRQEQHCERIYAQIPESFRW